tara:strand:+ start:201 stop:620 length:420 start_codon:yes stop_codon:yes gene_type:complete
MNCVYRIECLDKNIKEFYIGSSDNLNRRSIDHKSRCHNSNCPEYKYNVYKFIRANGGWDNWQIIVEYETPNYSEEDRSIEEQINKDLLKPQLNSYNAIGIDIEKKETTRKKHNVAKAKCPICDEEMSKNSIKRHIKRKH